VKELLSGREAALRAALSTITSTYMHHVLWPHSPYLLIITTRAMILARINRAALAAAARADAASGGASQVVHLCWQAPVVTHAALAAAAAASLAPTARASTSADAAQEDADAMRSLPLGGDADARGSGRRGRGGVAVGVLAGHVAYTYLLDSMQELCVEAASAVAAAAAAAAASVAAPAAGAAARERGDTSDSAFVAPRAAAPPAAAHDAMAKRTLHVRSSPPALMSLDAVVQRKMEALASRAPDDPVFALPPAIVAAMTADDAPLHWADAIATLGNVRPDESPLHNVQAVTVSLAYIDSAYVRHCRDRAAQLAARGGAAAAAEAELLSRVRGVDAETLLPLFHYVVAKSMIDRPVLCAVLANTWLQQHGLTDGRDGYALSMFKAACQWAAAAAV
jgi:hypothetical protein